MAKFTGRVTLSIPGQPGNISDNYPDATLDVGGIKRQEVVTDQGIGFYCTLAPAVLEATFSSAIGITDADAFRNLESGTVQFQCDTGESWIITNIFCTDTPVLTAGGKGWKVTLKGDAASRNT